MFFVGLGVPEGSARTLLGGTEWATRRDQNANQPVFALLRWDSPRRSPSLPASSGRSARTVARSSVVRPLPSCVALPEPALIPSLPLPSCRHPGVEEGRGWQEEVIGRTGIEGSWGARRSTSANHPMPLHTLATPSGVVRGEVLAVERCAVGNDSGRWQCACRQCGGGGRGRI